jgi:hypothetical protein
MHYEHRAYRYRFGVVVEVLLYAVIMERGFKEGIKSLSMHRPLAKYYIVNIRYIFLLLCIYFQEIVTRKNLEPIGIEILV